MSCKRKPSLKLIIDGATKNSEGKEASSTRSRSNSDMYSVIICYNVILGFVSRVQEYETPSVDSLAEVNVVRRSPMTAKAFLPALTGTRTRDSPHERQGHALATLPPGLHGI